MPSPVDKYFEQVKQDNPSYSDAQAWATAWSIYCKYKNPGSDSCHKDTSEYLKGKSARDLRLTMSVVSRFEEAQEMTITERVANRYAYRKDPLVYRF